MAISVVGTVDTGGTVLDDVAISRSWTSITGTNSAIIVFLPYYNSGSNVVVSSASWGATSLSRLSGNPGSPTGDDHIGEIWGAALGASHTAATNTLSVNFSGNTYCDAIIQQFDGVNQSSMTHDGGREATVESGTASITIANCVSTDFLIGTFIKTSGATAFTLGGSATQIHQATLSVLTSRRVVAMYRTGVTGSQAVSATFATTYHGGAAVALQEATGGGGGRTTKNTRGFTHGMEVGMNWRGAI